MGGEPAHRTNPKPGGPGFSVRVISPHRSCKATRSVTLDRGPYRVLSAGASRTLFFFSRFLLLLLLLSQPGLGPAMAELINPVKSCFILLHIPWIRQSEMFPFTVVTMILRRRGLSQKLVKMRHVHREIILVKRIEMKLRTLYSVTQRNAELSTLLYKHVKYFFDK
jgi:hypothetical protein